MKKSFTLIELLIVLIIIGIVAVLAVPQYQLWVIQIRGTEAMSNLRAITDSIWHYYLETGSFPAVGSGGQPVGVDIKLPLYKNPNNPAGALRGTKYFYFYYSESHSSWADSPQTGDTYYVQAIDEEVYEMGMQGLAPDNAIAAYAMGYVYNTPGPQRQKMDNNWYRYCYHIVCKKGGGWEFINSWPGSKE